MTKTPETTPEAKLPEAKPTFRVGQTVVWGDYAAIIVARDKVSADLQVFLPVQADRDNPAMRFVANVPLADLD